MERNNKHDPERPQNGPKYGPAPDLDTWMNDVVQFGTGLGSTVLSGIADALDRVGESFHTAQTELPFAKWKRKMDRRLQNKHQGEALALAITGWVLAFCFAVPAVVLLALSAAGPQALQVTEEEFLVFPILMACFTPIAVGFGIMGGMGVKKYRYIVRLRRYLHAARDWVCEIPALAQASLFSREQVERDLQQAVARGDLPNALLQEEKLYLDLERCAPQQTAVRQETPAEEPALEESEQFFQQVREFVAYLDQCTGKLNSDADEELERMRKICTSILEFVRHHPEQLPRVRRFRDYYLPTTRKLLATARGLGTAEGTNAQEIRRDITGILHTLNQAYAKLYDTLLQDVSLDVSAEIDTLETMLRQDGLTHDFASDFQNG